VPVGGPGPRPPGRGGAAVILYDNTLDADAYPVRLLLSALGLPCERVTIDSSPLALRGHGPRGPVLEDGGTRVIGAAAVLRHLAARHAPQWRAGPPRPRGRP